MDLVKFEKAVKESKVSVVSLCSKVGIDKATYYNNLKGGNFRIDILEKICAQIKVDIVDFFPQSNIKRKKANVSMELESGDCLFIDIDNKVLEIKKV